MAARLGRVVRGPVEVRVARRDGCGGSGAAEGAVIGEGRRGFVCINTGNVHWQSLAHSQPAAASAVAAHEYVHVLQAEAGCLPGDRTVVPPWLAEGMATVVGWRALRWSGLVSDRRVRLIIRRDGALGSTLNPLSSYERQGGRLAQYALWHQALRSLLRQAAARADESRIPERALLRFCERAGRGTAWRRAFSKSFGLTVGAFYARFEAARERRASTPDLMLR
jgi:hypothetical protein